MRIVKKIMLVLLLVFLIAQFFRPEKNDGDLKSIHAFLAETNPPKEVKLILEKACFDCHSDVTKYPWYNAITPVNYWLADHVKHGKKHFNVSDWEGNSTKRKDHKIEEVIETVESKQMPLESYTITHKDAKLTDAEIAAVIDWAKKVRFKYSLEKSAQ